MSFDSRLRDELRQAADAHDPREDLALQHVKATQPTEWAALSVVALQDLDSPRSAYVRAQRIVGALAACALLSGAIALPVALRNRSRDTAPAAAPKPVTTGFRSTVTLRIAPSPPPSTPTTQPMGITLADPVRLALAPGTRTATLQRSHLRSDDPGVEFDATTDATGDLLSLTVITPTRVETTTLARNWATMFVNARIADAKRQIREQQHQLMLRVTELHRELRQVDEQLVKLLPVVYKGVLRFDAPNGNLPGRGPDGPPPVPEQGSPRALNLAFERIQILAKLSESGKNAASLRITAVEPNVYATIVSQTPPVFIHPPHRNTSTVLLAIGLLLGGALLAGSAFMLGRRSRGLGVRTGGSR